MTIVVDASVALKWFLADEDDRSAAFRLVEGQSAIIAPDIVIPEVCNAAWRSARVGRITPDELASVARMVARFFQELVSPVQLVGKAVAVARELDHPVYDCLYLALAEARQTTLVTADLRLIAKLRGTGWEARCVALAGYAA